MGIMAALALLGLVAFAWIMQDPSRWPVDTFSRSIRDLAAEQAQGTVVWQRFETYGQPPRTLADFFLLTLKRAWHFGVFGAAFLTPRQNLFGALFFIPVFALGAITIRSLWRERRAELSAGDRRSDLVFASIGFVAAFWLFHSAVRVDFDWRYRLPVLPHLIFLAALAFDTKPLSAIVKRWLPARTSSPPPAPPPR